MNSIYLTEARVYIAGILMPTITVTITSTFNRPPVAEIVLPAYSELLYMGERDRIPVHVFVRETMVESPEFLLMFEGFITDTVYTNSALQRSVAVTAISHFDILNDVQVKFMTEFEDLYTSQMEGAREIQDFIYVNKYTFPVYLLKYGLVRGTDKPENKEIRFPSDYLENIYAYMQLAGTSEDGGDPYLKAQHNSVLSRYYSNQAQRLRFLDRFVRLPYFDVAGKDGFAWDVGQFKFAGPNGNEATIFPMMYGMQLSHAFGILAQGANNAAPNQSLMELLTYLVEEMEYEYLFITNPAYYSAKKTKAKKDTVTPEAAAAATSKSIAAIANGKTTNTSTTETAASTGDTTEQKSESDTDKLVSSCMKPLFNDTKPPMCNILYRSLVDNISMHVRHKGVPTRIQVTNTYSALERISKTINPSFLTMYGLIDYYPSEKYPVFEDSGSNTLYKKYLGSEILSVEKYTGPWLTRVHTPRWFHYLNDNIYEKMAKIKVDGQEVDAAKVFKERFFRRQLLNSKYFDRQLQANCMFDPYITPGFPGVVFDSGDSSFAFAGHVVTVVHTISPATVSTQVAMNFVRPLHEASLVEIPNPITSIQDVTHNVSRLSEIYQRILGSDAVDFPTLESQAITTESPEAPNNNPNAAYLAKRRNIASFEEYLKFMGFEATYGNGPEGPNTPIMLTSTGNKNWLEDRYGIPVYSNQVTFDKLLPQVENVIGSVAAATATTGAANTQQQQGQQQDGLTDNPGGNSDTGSSEGGSGSGGDVSEDSGEGGTGESSGEGGTASQNESSGDVGMEWSESSTGEASTSESDATVNKIQNNAASEKQRQESSETNQNKIIRKAVVADVRTLLRSIAEREFSRMIYK